ncbi:MAG: NYN domain-containing protein [bacterium]
MYYSAKNLYGAKVNFGNIVKEAIDDRKLIRAIAYVVRTESKDEQPFFDALYNLGIETKERPLQVFYGGDKKADWDVGITVDMIRLSPSLDAIVLVSGDGDYVPLVEYLRNQGKQLEAMAFGGTTSKKLIESVDDFVDLGGDKKKFLINDNRKKH